MLTLCISAFLLLLLTRVIREGKKVLALIMYLYRYRYITLRIRIALLDVCA